MAQPASSATASPIYHYMGTSKPSSEYTVVPEDRRGQIKQAGTAGEGCLLAAVVTTGIGSGAFHTAQGGKQAPRWRPGCFGLGGIGLAVDSSGRVMAGASRIIRG